MPSSDSLEGYGAKEVRFAHLEDFRAWQTLLAEFCMIPYASNTHAIKTAKKDRGRISSVSNREASGASMSE